MTGANNTLQNFDMLVIGASAGGVEAIGVLLEALPDGFAAAVAIVLHVPANRPSLLVDIFSRRTRLQVKEVEDKEPAMTGTVYVAAPDYHMLVEPSRLFSLSCDEPVHFSRPSIDVLFESAALAYRDRLLAIVLTGASADGADGLATVCRHGGQAWVQDPDEAQARTMPLAAIARSGTDQVLSLQEMARRLSGVSRPDSNSRTSI
ncbi:MAG TPA: chemotaxis protein CheB [Noviherbaspirillum sp.]|jgi:two-component system chemotaxis response regulator CheB|uniref:chemotaxis protein CheB n=1 Tax=Noviherbaspirillum sp. TaxID=1926288 RepID=UPI002DDD82F9|nr:chemotaxis protein CheB [Noviherbaspirillum sp.]HEV2610714.1 chemotaxis protein CheB [Noviherbaspirillum sp.]